MFDKEELKRPINRFILISILAIIYFISGKISLNFAFLHQSASPFWIPTGISITAFIIWGYKIWPSIFIGAFFVNMTTAGTVSTSLGIAVGNTLEGVTALYLIHKFIRDRYIFEKPLNIFKYVLLVGLLATMVSAKIGVTSLYLGGFIKPDNFFPVLTTWWLGNMGGALITAPVLLLWIAYYKIAWIPRRIFEIFIIFSLLIITSVIIFENPTNIKLPFIMDSYPFGFMTIPILILITFRFSLRETASAIFIFTLIALTGTIDGSTRLAFNDPNSSLLNLQIFTGLIFMVIMPVSAAITKQRKLEETFRESEERYRMLAETAPDAIITINEESKILFCNPSTKKIFGYSIDELIGKEVTILMPDYLKDLHRQGLNRYLKTGKQNIPWSAIEFSGLHKNGNEIPLEISYSKFKRNGKIVFTGIIRDITDRKNAQLQMENSMRLLGISESRYKNIFETAGVSIWEEDFSEVKNLIDELKKKGIKDFRKYFDENEEVVLKTVSMVKLLDVNEQTLKLYKAKTKNELLSSLNKVFLPETITAFKEELIAIAEEKNYLEAETVEKNLDGEKLNILFTIRFPDKKNDYKNILVSIMDITARKKAEEEIEASLNEKEVLLREVHHRVKNNLQIISSLLSLQSGYLSNENFHEFFIKSQSRVKSIAIVHEMLYKNENISKVNFKNYIAELSRYIAESYNAENIEINVYAEDIYFETDVTINLGLMINEIIANSIKHAFNGIKEGKIIIELKKNNSFYLLNISDNGKGLPDLFDLNETNTLGMQLITSLVTQIDGKLEIKNKIGTEYLISFEVE